MEKALAVIASCKTMEQLMGADNYARLWYEVCQPCRDVKYAKLQRAIDRKAIELGIELSIYP